MRLPNAGPIGDSGQVDSRRWDERYAGAEFEWTTRPNRFVAAELAELPPGRALDLAAGEGRNSVWLAERGWRVTAVDFSQVGLAKGRELAAARSVDAARIEWIVADLCDYEPDPGYFDVVLDRVLPGGRGAARRRPGCARPPRWLRAARCSSSATT